VERGDERMGGQQASDDGPLNTPASTMHQAHDPEPALVRSVQVLVHDRRDVTRRERVEVDCLLDGNVNRFVGIHGQSIAAPGERFAA
jgi:hypothetical protein